MDINDREKLIRAFEHMVEQVGDAIDDAEEAIAPTVDEMVHNAQVLARDLYALTQEEAESLGEALRRDIHKANETLNREGKQWRDWLSFDLELIEDRFLDMIARAADKTWLDFRAFERENRAAGRYRSGEVCNAGTLRCDRCGHRLRFARVDQIPDCPECGHGEFHRIVR